MVCLMGCLLQRLQCRLSSLDPGGGQLKIGWRKQLVHNVLLGLHTRFVMPPSWTRVLSRTSTRSLQILTRSGGGVQWRTELLEGVP